MMSTAADIEYGEPRARALIEPELKPMPRHAGDDESEARPRVEEPVEEAQLGRPRRELQEAKRGAEG
jgi:hypothetical protein